MFTVTELAHEAAATPHVVRYYARIGLIKPSAHQQNGYRLFPAVPCKYGVKQYLFSELTLSPPLDLLPLLRHHMPLSPSPLNQSSATTVLYFSLGQKHRCDDWVTRCSLEKGPFWGHFMHSNLTKTGRLRRPTTWNELTSD